MTRNGWTASTVGEIAGRDKRSIAIGPFGSSMRADVYTSAGTPVIRGRNIGPGKEIDESDLVYVPDSVTEKFPACMVRQGDLVFPHRGAIGRVALVGQREFMLSTSMMKLSVDTSQVDPLFMFYYFRGPGQRELLMRASTVGTPGIAQPLKSLREIPVFYPPLAEQQAIAEVLGALDDKIAANATLVSKADELIGTTYASLVAEGVEVPLSSLAEFINGKAFTKNATGTGRVVVRIAELNSGISGSTVYNDIDVPDRHLARPGDLLFAWSGSLTVRRWFRPEAIVNQHIFKVVPRDVPMWVVKGALDAKLAQFRAIAADKATTMGHIQRRHLDEPVAVPSEDGIARHDASMSALWHRALLAERESMQLGVTRDALLPGLMSGKIRVKDAEQAVGDVI